jgi:hypothetical protein
MIIKINNTLGNLPVLIETQGKMELSGLSPKGVSMDTDRGAFYISQSGQELDVVLDGKLVWSSSRLGGE